MVAQILVDERTKNLVTKTWPISPPMEDVGCLVPGKVCVIRQGKPDPQGNTAYGKSLLFDTNCSIDESLSGKTVQTDLGEMVVDLNAEDALAVKSALGADAVGTKGWFANGKKRVNKIKLKSVFKSELPELETSALEKKFLHFIDSWQRQPQ
jgi:hypothetical protein